MPTKSVKSSGRLHPFKVPSKDEFTIQKRMEIIKVLESRFIQNTDRCRGITWSKIKNRIEKSIGKLWSVYLMEISGGEPNFIEYDVEKDECIIFDCSTETPEKRRHVCYDYDGQVEREKDDIYPRGNAVDIAKTMGIELLSEDDYRKLQTLGDFDTRTSSWLKTPERIRKLGGAIFGNRRFDTVFIYHNTAKTFFSDRGFRGLIRV